ncbi:MAG: transcription termination factor NusA [Alphaproteobacteria bacterium]
MPEASQTTTAVSSAYARPELLQVADTVAREKSIEREEVLEAMEQAIQKAGRSKYGHELDIRAKIDRQSGEISIFRYREVVEEVENESAQMTPQQAREIDTKLGLGDFLVDPLPPIDFGRIAAQTAKQVIVQKVREAERTRQYAEYKDRGGEVVNGIVKRVEFGNVMVDLGRAEAVLRREDLIPRENFRQGDRVRAYIAEVREETRGPQIFLSRTHPQFMAKLFAQEVPEIYDSIIEIKAVARDPGSRAKIAVISNDPSIDPVGACVGMRGSRVQAVVAELQGEKIDIIPWSADAAAFVVNALAPAEVAKVVLDEDAGSLEVIVPEEQLSLAIGRRGQNVRLASQLSGWHIDILTEAEESERRQEEFRLRSQTFIDALDIDDMIAHILVTEGFTDLEQIAFLPEEDLYAIEGFEDDLVKELRQRARNYLAEREIELTKKRNELGVENAVAEVQGLSAEMLVRLGESGIKTLDDLADLTGDDLRFAVLKDESERTIDELAELRSHELAALLAPSPLSAEEADAIIMAARAHWFPDEEPAGEAGDAEDSAEGAPEGDASPQGGAAEAKKTNGDAE